MTTNFQRHRRNAIGSNAHECPDDAKAKTRGAKRMVCSVSSTKRSQAVSLKLHTTHANGPDHLMNENSDASHQVVVAGLVEHVDRRDFSVDLRFFCIDGSQRIVRVSRDELDHVGNLRRFLLKKGATKASVEKAALEGLRNALPNEVSKITSRLGWHGVDIFLLPRRTFGATSLTYDLPPNEKDTNYRGKSKGSLRGWRKGLKKPLDASSYLIFGLALGFAAPIGALTGLDETAVFHVYGESNAGKTLMAKVAESILGRATERDLQNLNQTKAGFNDVMPQYDGTLLPVNELKTGNAAGGAATYLPDFAHILTLGVGRNRADSAKLEVGMQTHRWRLFGMTNMEQSLERLSKGPREDGERARHIDLPVPATRDGGIFDGIVRSNQSVASTARALAQEAEMTLAEHYGVAFPKFIDYVIGNKERTLRRFQQKSEIFVEKCVTDKSDNWGRRLAVKFGYVYAGGSLAIMAGVLPCTHQQLRKACAELYRKAQANLQGEKAAKNDALDQLLTAMDDSKRFPRIEAGDGVPKNFDTEGLGFVRHCRGKGDCVFVKPLILQEWAGGTERYRWLMDHLKFKAAHVPDHEGKLTQARSLTGKGRERYICLTVEALRRMKLA